MGDLELLVQAVHKSAKYRNISVNVVRNVGARELAARRNLRDAVKATKNKLHQVGGAYWDSASYAGWLDRLRRARSAGDDVELRRICREAMGQHSSTRERLVILDSFYTRTLAGLPPPRVVLDLACGLNPMAIPWMPLAQKVQYYACDMYTDLAGFLNEYLRIMGIQGQAEACDVLQSAPGIRADLALILKTLPCAEQLDRAAAARLLDVVQADHLLVSFPVRSLGGRDKKMLENYEAHFQELLLGKPWVVQRFEFPTELAFLVHK